MKKHILILSLLALILVPTACKKETDTRGIDLAVSLVPEQPTDFLFLNVNYNFTINESFSGIPEDYKMFVHFWRIRNKQMLLQDDHEPETPLGQWRAGSSFSYSRQVFVPQFMNEFDIDFKGYEDIQLTVGLARPAEKGEDKIILFSRKLRFEPASFVAPEMIYDQGWYEMEIDPGSQDPFRNSWRWTARQASCFMENPRKDARLIIEAAVNKGIYQDQQVTIRINDRILDEFIPEEAFFRRDFLLTPEMMGENDEFYLIIETDKAFVPALVNPDSTDNRELGMQVFFLYFRTADK